MNLCYARQKRRPHYDFDGGRQVRRQTTDDQANGPRQQRQPWSFIVCVGVVRSFMLHPRTRACELRTYDNNKNELRGVTMIEKLLTITQAMLDLSPRRDKRPLATPYRRRQQHTENGSPSAARARACVCRYLLNTAHAVERTRANLLQ